MLNSEGADMSESQNIEYWTGEKSDTGCIMAVWVGKRENSVLLIKLPSLSYV